MLSINPLIKIQKGKKTFLIQRPSSIKELSNKVIEKFNLQNLNNLSFIYQDSNQDKITIENNDDLLMAFDYMEDNLKIQLEKKVESTQEEKYLTKDDFEIYHNFLKESLPVFDIDLKGIIDKGEIPCKDCYFLEDKSKDGEDDNDSFISKDICLKCKGKGQRKIDNNWSLILFLIDFKIKQYILEPIHTFNEDNSVQYDSNNKKLITSEKTALNSDKNTYRYLNNNFKSDPVNKIKSVNVI
jgi:hypothetical protein